MSSRTRIFASFCSATLHTLAFPYWAWSLLVIRLPFITHPGSRSRRSSIARVSFTSAHVNRRQTFPRRLHTNYPYISWTTTVAWSFLAVKESGKVGTVQKGPIRILPLGWDGPPFSEPITIFKKEEEGMVAELGGTKCLPQRQTLKQTDTRSALSVYSKKRINP